MKKILAILAWAAASALSAAPSAYDSSTAGQQGVVLVVNRNVPAGLELARYYASRRGVPAERVLALDLPTAESMSRRDYERLLRDPLLAALREQKLVEQVRREEDKVGAHESGWTTVRSEVRYLVLFHGVPLRVEDSKPWPLDKVARLVNQLGVGQLHFHPTDVNDLLKHAAAVLGVPLVTASASFTMASAAASSRSFARNWIVPTPSFVSRATHATLSTTG